MRPERDRRVATLEVDGIELINFRERVVRTSLRDGPSPSDQPWVKTRGYSRTGATRLAHSL